MAHASCSGCEMEWPEAVARARHFLGGPQYWAWRFSGAAATELTYLGAQSHLWDVRRTALHADRRRARLAAAPAGDTAGVEEPGAAQAGSRAAATTCPARSR